MEVRKAFANTLQSLMEKNPKIVMLDADLAKLVAAKVITSPDYWKKTAPTVRYLPELLHNMAPALR